ncbi:excalibur calcium-binding domain-containing protein, partial [Staphylococcus pseudintermedius]
TETNKQQSFANCKHLRQVYPNGVTADHPAYRPHLDRDKDKRACEPDKY